MNNDDDNDNNDKQQTRGPVPPAGSGRRAPSSTRGPAGAREARIVVYWFNVYHIML